MAGMKKTNDHAEPTKSPTLFFFKYVKLISNPFLVLKYREVASNEPLSKCAHNFLSNKIKLN